jgi:hypothetical protein
MSYSVYLYHPAVREEVEKGQDIDAFAHPRLDSAAVTDFLSRLEQAGYLPHLRSVERQVFRKPMGGSYIEASVFDTEISFSVAGNEPAVASRALQDASSLKDVHRMTLLNPQAGGWQDD